MKYLFILLLTAGIVSAQSVSSSGGSSGGASSNDFKENVRVATTANITIATALNNGDTLDGVTLATGNRVLVKDQSTPSQNGIYTVSASPARASDSNTWAKIAGSLVAVGSEGTTNRNKIFLNDSAPTGTLGSTSLSYIEKAASGMGSGDALVANPLSQFAATTSNQLLTTLNDETGTGVSVFGTSPTFTTSLLTGSTTFSLFNSTATTLNFGGAATTLNIGSSAATILNFGGAATAAQFRFLEPSGSGTNYTGFKAQAQAGNVTYTLPAADGTNGQFLKTNGTGTLSWATASGGLTGSAGGNGAADSGKAALFDAGGQITSSDGITILKTTGGYGANFDPDMLTASRAYSLPDASGELATKEWIALQGYAASAASLSATQTFSGQNTFSLPIITPTTEALSATTALVANKSYSGAIDTRTVTLSSAASFNGSHIHFLGTAAASTVITWPATTVRQIGGSGYASSTTFAAGNVEFDLWSNGTDWFLSDSSGTAASTGAPSDTAYDATSWNGNTDAPTKNAVRDKIESLSSSGAPTTATYRQNVTIWDEMLVQSIPSSGPWGPFGFARTVASGVTSTGTVGATDTTSPGIISMSTSTSASGAAGFSSQNTILFGGGTYVFETRVQVDDLAAGGENYTVRIGFLDSVSGEPTDGCYFRYSEADASWFAVCRANNVETSSATDTAVDVAADTWTVLRIEVNAAGTSCVFKIDGTTVRTETANIPASSNRHTGLGMSIIKSALTSARTMYCDYVGLDVGLTASR